MNARWPFLILIATLVGCAARPDLEAPTMTAEPGLYDGRTGDRVSLDDAMTQWVKARIVVVGESHDSADDHAVQLEVLQGVADRHEQVALGMEMFQRPFQAPLDQFVAGEIDEAAMLEATEWKARWGFATELYRPLWAFAAERGLPILALNARRELTKRIAKVGVDGLTETEKDALPELDLTNEAYLEWMDEVFRSHGSQMESQKLERFYSAQVAWDETMADTAAQWAIANPKGVVVIAAGRGHVERDWGIPSRARRRLNAEFGDGTVVSIIPVDTASVPRWDWAKKNRFGDYVWVYEKARALEPDPE